MPPAQTYSVAMFVVACAAGVENIEQAIFSTGRRASKKLLDLVYKLLRKIPGLRDSVIVRNVETIWIRGPGGEDDIRKIYSYPSKASVRRFAAIVFYVFGGGGGWRSATMKTAGWRLKVTGKDVH